MKKTIFFILFLTESILAFSQQVISPQNFLKYNSDPYLDEAFVNVYEMPGNAGFLFPINMFLPQNGSNEYFSSARIVKSDAAGKNLYSFTVPVDTVNRIAYVALQAWTTSNEILFMVSQDSVRALPLKNRNYGLLIYHLSKADLSLISVDTFYDFLPANSYTFNSYQVQASNEIVYGIFPYHGSAGDYSILYKISSDVQNKLQIKKQIVDTHLIPKIVMSSIYRSNSLKFNKDKDSLEISITCGIHKNNMIELGYLLALFDTAFTGAHTIGIDIGTSFQYMSGIYMKSDLFNNGLRLKNKVFLGGTFYVKKSFPDRVGLLRYNITNDTLEKKPEKGLLFPDSVNFSYISKLLATFQSADVSGSNLYVLASDFDDLPNLFYNSIENHLYIGKTDTSLNAWHWYKYIGNPNTYHMPYTLLATSDGGCLITCGVYDFVNSPVNQHDVYIIKLDGNGFVTNVTNLTPDNKKSVTLYPVPAQNELFLSYTGNDPYDLLIYDASGKIVLNHTGLKKNNEKISFSNIASGNYFYQIRFRSGKTESGKLIKQ